MKTSPTLRTAGLSDRADMNSGTPRLPNRPAGNAVEEKKKKRIRIFALAAGILLLFDVIGFLAVRAKLGGANDYDSLSAAYSQGGDSDAILFALENGLLADAGFAAADVSRLGMVEKARSAMSKTSESYTYTYFIGGKTGRSVTFETFAAGRMGIEEGRGSVCAEIGGNTVELVRYYYRDEYLVRLSGEEVSLSVLLSSDLEPCADVAPGNDYSESYDRLLGFIDKSDIEHLIDVYNDFTRQTLNGLM